MGPRERNESGEYTHSGLDGYPLECLKNGCMTVLEWLWRLGRYLRIGTVLKP